MSNYPPGVSGNEPEITGIWPAHELADHVDGELAKALRALEEVESVLDDQGAYGEEVGRQMTNAVDGVQTLKDHMSGYFDPPEPEGDDR